MNDISWAVAPLDEKIAQTDDLVRSLDGDIAGVCLAAYVPSAAAFLVGFFLCFSPVWAIGVILLFAVAAWALICFLWWRGKDAEKKAAQSYLDMLINTRKYELELGLRRVTGDGKSETVWDLRDDGVESDIVAITPFGVQHLGQEAPTWKRA